MRLEPILHEMDPRHLLVKRPIMNYGSRLNWAIWAFTVASAIFLALRLYCKLTRARTLWWDDHFLIGSWLAILVASAMLTEAVKAGLGHHWDEMPDYTTVPYLNKMSYGAGFCTTVATAWSKTSFGITLLRLSNGWVRWLVWFIIISVNLVLGFAAAMMWIQCWPIAKLWTWGMPGTCWPLYIVQNYTMFASIYSGALDIILSILPWRIVWKVAINKKEKIGALVAMSFGVFSGIISFLKIISLDDISDSSSTTVDVKIFNTAEPAVTIIAVSIPILRAFFRRDAAQKSTSIRFIQFSQIPEPTGTGRSGPSFDKKDAADSDIVLVTHNSSPSQASRSGQDIEMQPR